MVESISATVIRASKGTTACAVRDLSPSGARLVGPLDVFEGEPVQIQIDLEEPLVVTGEVTRIDRQSSVAEVAFRGLDAHARALIERSIATMLAEVQTADRPLVVIVHPDVATSSALERDLARVGIAARVLATLDDLDQHLGGTTIGVIIAGSFGEAVGPALELVERREELRRVILHGDRVAKIEHPAAARVDAVLRTPWHFKGLARALNVSSDAVTTTYQQLVALKPK